MNNLRDEQIDILKTLYPSYREEVYRRREQMMKLTAFACSFLVLLLITMLGGSPSHSGPAAVLFAVTGVALFAALFAYLILQQRTRHRMAKQALIEIERLLGLYDEGWSLEGRSLYPDHWQTDWQADRSVTVYLTILAAFTVLVIAAVLTRL